MKYFLNASRPPSSYRCIRSETTLHLLIQSVDFRRSTAFSGCPDGSIPEPRNHPQNRTGKLPAIASFPTAQSPRFAGKKVFVIRRQQAIMPNHCSSSNKNCLLHFYGIAAPAMPFGCSASLRSLSCCLQFLLIPHGSYCVLHATSFIPSSVPLHYTSFAAIHLLQGRASLWPIHKATHKGMHQPFASQRYNTHRVPFRCTTSFIHFSSVQSTRCPFFLLAGCPHFGCVR